MAKSDQISRTMAHRSTFSMILLPLLCIIPAKAEIHMFNKALFPGDSGVIMMDDTIQSPGEIDLSGLQLTAIPDPKHINGVTDPFLNVNKTEDSQFFVDVLVVRTDPPCLQSKQGCDWPVYGIGALTPYNEFHFCCSEKLQAMGLCNHTNQPATPLGHLILDKSLYTGERKPVLFDKHQGLTVKQVMSRKILINETGTYVVMLANCNMAAQTKVFARGAVAFESQHGYLPATLYKFLWFYVAMSVLYFGLTTWFSLALRRYGSLAVEYTVLWALVLGLMESVFLALDLGLWNVHGDRIRLVAWLAMLTDVLQQGLTMAVVSIIATGRGLTGRVFGVGLSYIAVSLTRAVLVYYYEDNEAFFDYDRANRFETSIWALTQLMLVMDIGIVLWVMWSLQSTLKYLKERNQTAKLARYYQFRCFLSVVLLFTIVVVLLNLGGAESWGDEDELPREWILTAASTLNVLFVLLGVALLWRPSPDSKVYGTAFDDPSDDNEIELRPTTNGGFRDDLDGNEAAGQDGEDVHEEDLAGGDDDDLEELPVDSATSA